jgi:serine/threonine protein kinase
VEVQARVEVQEKVGGRYTLLDKLGTGGMAVVWRARDEVLGRSVAVKLLAGRYADDAQWRARIRDEARAAAKLSPHPHIAQVYDYGDSESDGTSLPYVVMELVNGPTLQERVADGPLPPSTVFRICGEVASALEAAHAEGLVHRDIKPANVIVTPAGAKVVDFGIAATAGPGEPEDVVLGTPAYLAPERLTGGAVQPASDMYALGVLLYRLLANESPWTVESTTQMLTAHVYVEPAPLPPLPGVPEAVTDLVHRCLRKDPADRPPAAEAAAVLADAAAAEVREEPVRSVPGQRRAEAAAPPVVKSLASGSNDAVKAPANDAADRGKTNSGKRRMIIALLGVVVVLAAAVLVWALLPSSDSSGKAGQATPATASHQPPPTGGQPTGPTTAGAAPVGGAAPGTAPVPGATVQTTAPATRAANPGTTRATDPDGTAPPPTTRAPASSAPASRTRTLSSSAGTVKATCSAGKAHLTSWTAKDPYHVDSVTAGPALTTAVVFAHGISRIRMTVTCVAGTPTAVVLPL